MVTEYALKLIVEAQDVKAENMISVGHCIIPLGKGYLYLIAQLFVLDYKLRLFWPHMHLILHGIKRSWHFIIVGVENVSYIQITITHSRYEEEYVWAM